MDQQVRVRTSLLAGSAAAFLLPVALWTVFLVFGSRRPRFDFLRDAASNLGGVGAPDATVYNLLFFTLGGLLTLVVAAALLRSGLPGRGMGVAAVLVALTGVSLILEGIVRTDPTSAAGTRVHQALGLPLMLAMPLAPLVLAVSLRGVEGLGAYRLTSAFAGAGLVLVAMLSLVLKLPPGTFQRSSAVLATVWFFATGGLLLRLAGNKPRPEALPAQEVAL